jgi:hypothetical protein
VIYDFLELSDVRIDKTALKNFGQALLDVKAVVQGAQRGALSVPNALHSPPFFFKLVKYINIC